MKKKKLNFATYDLPDRNTLLFCCKLALTRVEILTSVADSVAAAHWLASL